MRRRDFIASAGAVAALSTTSKAQQAPRPRRIGILLSGEEGGAWQSRLNVFREALFQAGWVDGRNAEIVVKWAGHLTQSVEAQAQSLVALEPDVILVGPTNSYKAVQAKTRTIPLVFVLVSDPLGQGLVDSLARPSGNATGFTNLEFSMVGKWMELLKEMAPGLSRVGLMIHTSNGSSASWYRTFDSLAPKVGVTALPAPVTVLADVEAAFARLAGAPNSGLIIPGDSFVSDPRVRKQIIGLAARLRLPTLSAASATGEFVAEGGLVSYGIDGVEPFRLAAGYVDRILKGTKPSDLPVQQPKHFHFAINLKTARALGLTVPLTLQVAADEVIE
jgi:putative ABC transport system substrate-binding protein